jgi:hypothetical protein
MNSGIEEHSTFNHGDALTHIPLEVEKIIAVYPVVYLLRQIGWGEVVTNCCWASQNLENAGGEITELWVSGEELLGASAHCHLFPIGGSA